MDLIKNSSELVLQILKVLEPLGEKDFVRLRRTDLVSTAAAASRLGSAGSVGVIVLRVRGMATFVRLFRVCKQNEKSFSAVQECTYKFSGDLY